MSGTTMHVAPSSSVRRGAGFLRKRMGDSISLYESAAGIIESAAAMPRAPRTCGKTA